MDMTGLIEIEKARTDAVHTKLNLRTHDLVPSVDTPYQPPATLKATGTAEWVCKGGGGSKVCLEGFALG